MSDDELRDWLYHSTRLCHTRLEKLPEDADWRFRRALQNELTARKFVLQHLKNPLMQGAAAVWRDYMITHAHLELQAKADRNQKFFLEQCYALIRKRDADLKDQVGVAWLPVEGQVLNE